MKNKGLIIGVIAIAIIALGWWFWKEKNQQSSDKQVVKIGVILPLTGEAAAYGNSLKKGLELNSNKSLEFIFEDSKADPKTAVNAMNKLVSANNVKIVIGDMFTNTTMAINPIASKSNVLLITPTASSSQISETGSTTFRLYPSEKEEAELLSDFYKSNFKDEKTEIIVVNEDAMLKVADIIANNITANKQVYSKGITNFNSIISKIPNDVKNIFIIGYIEESTLLIKQSKELNKNYTFIGLSTLYTPQLTSLLGNISSNIYLSAPYYSLESESKVVKNFLEAYKAKYNNEIPDVWAGYGYDAALIIDYLQKNEGKKSYIEKMYDIKDFDAVTGTLTINKDRSILKKMNILKYENGDFKTVQ